MLLAQNLLKFFKLPTRCWTCHTWARSSFCSTCVDKIAPWGELPARCTKCGLRVPWGIETCISCQCNPPPQQMTLACLDYDQPWIKQIRRFKFHGYTQLAHAWAELMVNTISLPSANGLSNKIPEDAWLVPIPLSLERLRDRGYNQAWELARHCGRKLCLSAKADVLLRTVDIPQQVGANRTERLMRLKGIFELNPLYLSHIKGKKIILMDDVYTTGATTSEASHTLLNAGAASVWVWVLARTPAPDDEPG